MRTPPLAFLVAAFLILPRVVFCYDESPWQPVLYDYYHIDLSELGAGPHGHGVPVPDYGGYAGKVPIPRDTIVDVINDLGIKLLAIHNEHNDNNIAISPYGAFSVLAALSEGLQGDSAYEILHAAHIPKDKHVIRVGLRDIHRHLKSYFIPQEGFLAGLTLNLNNVTLRSEYEDVLHFYGFDYGSFNNALYPEPLTTKKPSEATTLETGLAVSDGTTIMSTPKIQDTTTEISIRLGGPSTEKPPEDTTAESERTTTILMSTENKGDPTTATEQQSTQPVTTTKITTLAPTTTTTTEQPATQSTDSPNIIQTVTAKTFESTETFEEKTATISEKINTTIHVSTSEIMSTTKEASIATTLQSTTESTVTSTKPPETTTRILETTTKLPEATTTTITTTTTEAVTSTKPPETTTKVIETTTKLPEATTTTITTTTTEEVTTTSTKSPATTIVSTTVLPTTTTTKPTTTVESTMTSGNTIRTTREITMEPENLLTTVTPPITETTIATTQITTNVPTILTEESTTTTTTIETETIITTISPLEDTTVPFVGLNDTEVQNELVDATTSPQFAEQMLPDVESTTPFFFGTTPEFQDTVNLPEGQNNFDFNYNYDANNVPPAYDENMVNPIVMPDPPQGAGFNDNFKRSARSIVDYVIARFYDDPHHYRPPPPQRPQYMSQDPLTFAIYGKFRESGINFMKYDTVLPYFFVQNLNALALSFPLDSTKYYLLLLLPLRDNGVDQLICDLRLHGNLRYIIDNLKLTHVVATIPSFMLKGYVTLTPALQTLGIRQIFEPRQADFSPMTNVTDIYVTNIEQAVTVTIRNYLDPSAQRYKNFRRFPPVHFKADHPFLYFVIDSDLHVALMVGKVINPLNSRIR